MESLTAVPACAGLSDSLPWQLLKYSFDILLFYLSPGVISSVYFRWVTLIVMMMILWRGLQIKITEQLLQYIQEERSRSWSRSSIWFGSHRVLHHTSESWSRYWQARLDLSLYNVISFPIMFPIWWITVNILALANVLALFRRPARLTGG